MRGGISQGHGTLRQGQAHLVTAGQLRADRCIQHGGFWKWASNAQRHAMFPADHLRGVKVRITERGLHGVLTIRSIRRKGAFRAVVKAVHNAPSQRTLGRWSEPLIDAHHHG